MKLTLKNFRCWENNTFEIPDNQLTLISGPSGNGKSTILMAIHFALYGSNNHRYLVTHNKQSCEVVMEYGVGEHKFKIKRTKRPNIVNVWVNGRLFEDAEAQVVIDRHFGQSSIFCNFLDMSISDKAHFLEKIVNSTYNINILKDTLKKDILNVNKELATIEGRLLTSEEMCKIILKPDKVDKPVRRASDPPVEPDLSSRIAEVSKTIQRALSDQRTTFGLMQQKLALQLTTEETCLVPLEQLEREIEETESEMSTVCQSESKCVAQKERAKLGRASLAQQERELATLADASVERIQTLQTQLSQTDEQLQANLRLLPMYTTQQLKTKYSQTLEKEMKTWRKNISDLENSLNELPQTSLSAEGGSPEGGSEPRSAPRLRCGVVEESLRESLYKYRESAKFLKTIKEELQTAELGDGELGDGELGDGELGDGELGTNDLVSALCLRIVALKRSFFKSLNCPNCASVLTLDINTHEFVEPCSSPGQQVSDDQKVCSDDQKVCSDDQKVGRGELDAKLRDVRRLETLMEKCATARAVVDSIDVEDTNRKLQDIKRYNQLRVKLDLIRDFKPSETLQELKLALPSSTNTNHPENAHISDPTQTIDTLKEVKLSLERTLRDEKSRIRQKAILECAVSTSRKHVGAYDAGEHARLSERANQLSTRLARLKEATHVATTAQKVAVAVARLDSEIAAIGFDESKLLQLNTKLNTLTRVKKYQDDLNVYLEFVKNLKTYKKAKQALFDLRVLKSAKSEHYHKLLVFRKHVVDAETESLNSVVLSVNTHLQMFLDDFFTEDSGEPIQVYLQAINDKTTQINTIINYKGNMVDFKSLSAGEGARVRLAFDLTFKEILNENIIMLDECTANLDQDLTTKVCKKIKDMFPSKTILLVAHQVVSGLFDNNIKV